MATTILDRVILDSIINTPGGRMDGIVVEIVEASSSSAIATKFVRNPIAALQLYAATDNGDGTCSIGLATTKYLVIGTKAMEYGF